MIRPLLEAFEVETGLLGPLEDVVRDVTRMYERYAGMNPVPPSAHIAATSDEATVELELPGVDSSSLELETKDNLLRISGTRSQVTDAENDETLHYIRREREHGPFRRTVRLPFDVEVEAVKAVYRNGLLTVTLPRSEASKPRKIIVTG